MSDQTAAALRTAADIQAQLISDLETQAQELRQLRAERQEELDALTPADLSRQVTLRGEIMAADQMLTENAGTLSAARDELARLEGQGQRETVIERIQAITEEALEYRRRRELEVRELMEVLARELPKLVKPDGSYLALKNELRGLLLSEYGVHLDNDFDDLSKTREQAYRELEGRGVDMATIQSMSHQARPHHFKPVPLDHVDTTAGAGRYYELAQEVHSKALPIVGSEGGK